MRSDHPSLGAGSCLGPVRAYVITAIMLRDLAAQTGATAVSSIEAARGKDLVVLTIPEKNVPDLPEDLFAGTGEPCRSLVTTRVPRRWSCT